MQREKQSEHSFLQWFARYLCLLGHHSWDVSCLGQLYPHLSFAAWERSSGWALLVTSSFLKQKPDEPDTVSKTQDHLQRNFRVNPQLTGLTLLNPQSLLLGMSWLVVFHTVFEDCVRSLGFSPHSIYFLWLEVLRKIWDRDILSICRLGPITLQWSITGVKYSSLLI